MAWVKLDDQFPDHPKVERAGERAAWLFVCGLCYCAEHLTDGFIPASKAQRLTKSAGPRIRTLLDVGLWERVEGGFRVVGYLEYQPAGASVKERRADISRKRSEAGKRGAVARWGDGNGNGKRDGNGMAPSPYPTDVPTSVDTSTAVAPTSRPSSVVAIRREAAKVLDQASALAGERPILESERDGLWACVDEALRAGVNGDELAHAIAASPFRTPKGVLGELGKRRQGSGQSVGDRSLGAAAAWVAGREST